MVTRSRRNKAASAPLHVTPSAGRTTNQHHVGGPVGSSSSTSSSSPASNRSSSISRAAVKKATPPQNSNNKSISHTYNTTTTTKENPNSSSSADKYNTSRISGTMGLRCTRNTTSTNPCSSSSSSLSPPPLAKKSSSSPHDVISSAAKDTPPIAASSNSGGGKGTTIGSSPKKNKTRTSPADKNNIPRNAGEDISPPPRDTASANTTSTSTNRKAKTRSADTNVVDTTTPPDGDHGTLLSRRPKRKAASSVRFGSYKDMENNVDYTLLLDSFASSTSTSSAMSAAPTSSHDKSSTTSKRTNAATKSSTSSTRINAKKRTSASSNGGKRKSSKPSSPAKKAPSSSSSPSSLTKTTSAKKQHQGMLRMTRSNLMTSKKTTAGTVSTARKPQEQRPISLDNVTSCQRQEARLNLTTLLPPVLIDRCSGKITSSMLRSLSKDATIDIFNRKTGRIMRGDEAIPVKGLVRALQEHAEYEPILPCPKRAKIQPHTYRESRTSPNARVSSVVHPQTTMVRTSAIEGCHVLVTGGAQKGLVGKVHTCIPGGWYMITDASNPDDFEYLVHSKNLRMIKKKQGPTALGSVSDSTKSAGIKGTEGTKVVSPSLQKRRRDIYSRPTSQDILKLRNKIKELENRQLSMVNKTIGTNQGRNDVDKEDNTKKQALDVVLRALEETKSELQTKIFLDEILASRSQF